MERCLPLHIRDAAIETSKKEAITSNEERFEIWKSQSAVCA
jgi:hypothetical protein